jgi:hypothetical protein
MRTSVPYALVCVGDVIEDLGRFAVVTHLTRDKDLGLIQSVCRNGQRRQTAYRPSATISVLSRVGEHCTPSPQGLRDFFAKHPQ